MNLKNRYSSRGKPVHWSNANGWPTIRPAGLSFAYQWQHVGRLVITWLWLVRCHGVTMAERLKMKSHSRTPWSRSWSFSMCQIDRMRAINGCWMRVRRGLIRSSLEYACCWSADVQLRFSSRLFLSFKSTAYNSSIVPPTVQLPVEHSIRITPKVLYVR